MVVFFGCRKGRFNGLCDGAQHPEREELSKSTIPGFQSSILTL